MLHLRCSGLWAKKRREPAAAGFYRFPVLGAAEAQRCQAAHAAPVWFFPLLPDQPRQVEIRRAPWLRNPSRNFVALGAPPCTTQTGVALRLCPTAFCTAKISCSRLRRRVSSSALAPSDFACLGLSCTSRKIPSTPAATAARASRGINSGWPPLTAPSPLLAAEGSCTE